METPILSPAAMNTTINILQDLFLFVSLHLTNSKYFWASS